MHIAKKNKYYFGLIECNFDQIVLYSVRNQRFWMELWNWHLFLAMQKKITTIDKHVLQIILNNSYKLVALHAYDLHMNTLQLLLNAIYFKINTKSSYK